jgi:hypothetical protein
VTFAFGEKRPNLLYFYPGQSNSKSHTNPAVIAYVERQHGKRDADDQECGEYGSHDRHRHESGCAWMEKLFARQTSGSIHGGHSSAVLWDELDVERKLSARE